MKRLWLLLFLIPAGAFAESLHRCVAKDGRVSYQARACAHGMRTDRTIHYVPEVPEVQEELAIRPVRSQLPVRARVKGVSRERKLRVRTSIEPRNKEDRCRTARIRRAQALDGLGLKRTYAQLSRLDEPVREACKGF